MMASGLERAQNVRCLTFHADYACQNTGVCCSSGWQVAVEERVELALAPRLKGSVVRLPNGPDGFQPMSDPPAGCRSVLRRAPSGACWFRDDAEHRCAIHREFGETSLPSACRQFPRICVLEPDHVSLSLSHYCPTAAALLFRPPTAFAFTDAPQAFPDTWPFEGLDVRAAYPPFLRPGVLLGFDGLRAFEEAAVRVLSEPGIYGALDRVRSAVAVIRAWTPARGIVPDLVRAAFDQAALAAGVEPSDPRPLLLASLPPDAPGVSDLPAFTAAIPSFSALVDLALRRYLAARLVAGWIVYQAEDLAAVSRYLDLCLATVFLFESTRDRDEPEIDRWKESIRGADLWILHHCDPALLAANLR